MNAVIYCRVSSKEQVDGTSLESQEIACKEYALHQQLNVVRIFVEKGESAKFADRTQLLEMLTFCQDRKQGIKQLLVWKVDRLARNVGDHFSIKAKLSKLDVTVVSVTEPIDAKPEGKLLETILPGFAQFDNDIRATRTLQGMRRKIQEGIFPWKAPLGYKSSTVRGTKKTEPDQPDQPTFGLLQQAWNEFATGRFTKSQVRRLMTSRGLRTRSGKPISKQTWDYIFSDQFYAGILRDPWSGEEHIGRHLPMVSRDTFNAIQQSISGRGRTVPHRTVRPEFPLRTFARCAHCEHTLTGAFSRGRSKLYPYYRCYSRICDAPGNYPSAVVHEEFIRFLNQVSRDRHSLEHLKDGFLDVHKHRTESNLELSEKRAVNIGRIKEQQQQLIRMKMGQLITDQEFTAQRSFLATELSELEVSVSGDGPGIDNILVNFDSICDQLMDLGGTWDDLTTELKKRFQQLVLPAGYVFGRIGTAQKGRLFSFLEAFDTSVSSVVPLAGLSWNQLAGEINEFATILRESSSLVASNHEVP